MTREKIYPFNPGESVALKQSIYNLCPSAKSQALLGLIQTLALKGSIGIKAFKEILADAQKYSDEIQKP